MNRTWRASAAMSTTSAASATRSTAATCTATPRSPGTATTTARPRTLTATRSIRARWISSQSPSTTSAWPTNTTGSAARSSSTSSASARPSFRCMRTSARSSTPTDTATWSSRTAALRSSTTSTTSGRCRPTIRAKGPSASSHTCASTRESLWHTRPARTWAPTGPTTTPRSSRLSRSTKATATATNARVAGAPRRRTRSRSSSAATAPTAWCRRLGPRATGWECRPVPTTLPCTLPIRCCWPRRIRAPVWSTPSGPDTPTARPTTSLSTSG